VEPQKAGRVFAHQNAKGVGEGKGGPKFPCLSLTLSAAIRPFKELGRLWLVVFATAKALESMSGRQKPSPTRFGGITV
jgi:hypothetical protein